MILIVLICRFAFVSAVLLTLSKCIVSCLDLGKNIYVSQATGKDNTNCGTQSFPCKSISTAVERVPEGGTIFIDGTGTALMPYACKPFGSKHAGVYVDKSLAFEGFKSLAYITCGTSRSWFLNGSKDGSPTHVNFSALIFQQSRLDFQDVLINIKHCAFRKSPTFAMSWKIVSLNVFRASLDNVVFENNRGCISVLNTAKQKTQLELNLIIQNSVFKRNGATTLKIQDSQLDKGSVLYVNSTQQAGNFFIRFHNVLFSNHSVNIFYLQNNHGSAVVFMTDSTIVTNIIQNNRSSSALFVLETSNVAVKVVDTEIVSNRARFISIIAENAKLKFFKTSASNNNSTQVPSGGMLYSQSKSLDLLLNNCFISNTNTLGLGGVGFIEGENVSVALSSSNFTGHKSYSAAAFYFKVNHTFSFLATNCSFSHNFVRGQGSVFLFRFSQATIANLLFQACEMTSNVALGPGGAIVLIHGRRVTFVIKQVNVLNCSSIGGPPHGAAVTVNSTSEIELLISHSVFDANSVDNLSRHSFSGVINIRGNYSEQPGFVNFTAINVLFSNNKLDTIEGATLYFETRTRTHVNIHSTTFLDNNSNLLGSIVSLSCVRNAFEVSLKINHSTFKRNKDTAIYSKGCIADVSLHGTIFEQNIAGEPGGVVMVDNILAFSVSDSLFVANAAFQGGSLFLSCFNCTINITNTTFRDCFSLYKGGAVYIKINNNSKIFIKSSFFKNNSARLGGAVHVDMSPDVLLHTVCMRSWEYKNFAHISKTYFEANFAFGGGAFSVTNGKTTFQNCNFLNNFAAIQGGHFCNYGSSSVNFINCRFLQTESFYYKHKVFPVNQDFFKSSFIESYSGGPLLLNSTVANLQRPVQSSNPLMAVHVGGIVHLNNSSSILCPAGSQLTMLNTSYYLENKPCKRQVTAFQLSCSTCDTGFYSIQRGRSFGLRVCDGFHCFPCPYGADCTNNIIAKPSFWGFLVSESSQELTFIRCPTGYCQPPHKNSSHYNGCQGNRTGTLCGQCKPGYSEAFFSTHCRLDHLCDDYWFWAISLVLIIGMALYLITKPPVLTYACKEIFWFKTLFYHKEHTLQEEVNSLSTQTTGNKDEGQSTGFLKIIFYFYQVSNLLILSTSTETIVKTKIVFPLMGIFNFQPRFSHGGVACPFPGLNAITKQLFQTSFVFATVASICVIYGLHCFVNKVFKRGHSHKGPYFAAVLETLLLGYATLANVSFELLSCVRIESESRLFMSAIFVCFQWWQYLVMVFVGVYVVPFMFVLAWGSVLLHHGKIPATVMLFSCVFPLPCLICWLIRFLRNENKVDVPRDKLKKALGTVLYGPYRVPSEESRGFLYWESILIGCRFVLVALKSFLTEPMLRFFIMAIVCALILLHHAKAKPFRDGTANTAQFVSLSALVALATVSMSKSSTLALATEPEGPAKLVFTLFEWVEIILLAFLPVVFFFIIVLGLVSLICRLCFILYKQTAKLFSRSFGVTRTETLRPLLENETESNSRN